MHVRDLILVIAGSHLLDKLIHIIKPNRGTNFSNLFYGIKLYMFRTVPLSIIRSVFTVHTAMVYVIQVLLTASDHIPFLCLQ